MESKKASKVALMNVGAPKQVNGASYTQDVYKRQILSRHFRMDMIRLWVSAVSDFPADRNSVSLSLIHILNIRNKEAKSWAAD